MAAWTETCRCVVFPWECDVTEHFTIAYYFDRLAMRPRRWRQNLGLRDLAAPTRRFDVRFVRELRAGASFHILSAPIALDEDSVRFGHQVIDSANGEVTAWVEETLDHAAAPLPRDLREAIEGASWSGRDPLSSAVPSRLRSNSLFRRCAIGSSRWIWIRAGGSRSLRLSTGSRLAPSRRSPP